MFRKILLMLCFLPSLMAEAKQESYIAFQSNPSAFVLSESGKSAQILVSADDWKGVQRAANDLAEDIGRVTGVSAQVVQGSKVLPKNVIVGTLDKSPLVDVLVKQGKVKVDDIRGQWESYLIQSDKDNLYIIGSDKRGTIYGIYDLSEKIGVSPWYWWADVPAKKSGQLYVKAGRYMQPSPKVKYRGIFINNEEPSFCTWARTHFGGNNSKMYVHLFELLLRLKANYLWPAMWSSNFNEDDPKNPLLADEYGIVMGTSHHEPMMRSHAEYRKRRSQVGPWDYSTNKTRLDSFFLEGMERNKHYDNLVTIGMRGDGDVEMGKGNDAENIRVLHDVIDGQRNIIQKVYGKSPAEVPQLWAVYTEVQRYYDAGFNVPDDVTLLFCDNNWGYIRRIGPEKERNRKGGLGLYYHIDMNGGPWNDRWVNTTTIPKMREQLNMAYRTGIDRIWIVNVGDLKPRESAIDFIMNYAWNPDAIPVGQEMNYLRQFTAKAFGDACADEAADLMAKYTKYNLWRKPEVETTDYFSIVNYHEADSLLALWQDLANRADALKKKIPAEAQDAFYQLVYYPVKGSAGVAQMYIYAGMNQYYGKQGRIIANEYAQKAKELFEEDKRLTDYYNNKMLDGKWKGMMLDKHIGYQKWSMPAENKLPDLIEVTPDAKPELMVAVEGREEIMTGTQAEATLPTFASNEDVSQYVDICNKGEQELVYKIKTSDKWIVVDRKSGKVKTEDRLMVRIDWKQLAEGCHQGWVKVTGNKQTFVINVEAVKENLDAVKAAQGNKPCHITLAGEMSIPAEAFCAEKHVAGYPRWTFLPDLGRSNGCMGADTYRMPPAQNEKPLNNYACLEYDVYVGDRDTSVVCLGILPTQDIHPEKGLKIAVSVNDGEIIEIDARKGFVDTFNEYNRKNLSRSKVLSPLPRTNKKLYLNGVGRRMRNEVFDNLRWLDVKLPMPRKQVNHLKVWMVSPEIVLEHIIVNPDNARYCYFGKPSVSINR